MSGSNTEGELSDLDASQLQNGPQVAIDIGYSVAEEYHSRGLPPVGNRDRSDNWPREGPLAGGRATYLLRNIKSDTPVEFEFKPPEDDRFIVTTDDFPDDLSGLLEIKWGRHASKYPGQIELTFRYDWQWSHSQEDLQNRVRRYFTPPVDIDTESPHFRADRDTVLEWIKEFCDHPEKIGGESDIRFIGGEAALNQIQSEVANLFVDPSEPDVVSIDYVIGRYNVNRELAEDLLWEITRDRPVNSLDCFQGHPWVFAHDDVCDEDGLAGDPAEIDIELK